MPRKSKALPPAEAINALADPKPACTIDVDIAPHIKAAYDSGYGDGKAAATPVKDRLITLQFVGDGSCSSRVIAWFSAGFGTKALSHVDAVLEDGSLLGARSDNPGGYGTGVRIRPPNYKKFSRVVRMTLPVTADGKERWLAFLNDQVGKPYDSKAIWGFAEGKNLHTNGDWICSALQSAGVHASGAVGKLFLPYSRITPESLALGMSFAGASAADDDDEKESE